MEFYCACLWVGSRWVDDELRLQGDITITCYMPVTPTRVVKGNVMHSVHPPFRVLWCLGCAGVQAPLGVHYVAARIQGSVSRRCLALPTAIRPMSMYIYHFVPGVLETELRVRCPTTVKKHQRSCCAKRQWQCNILHLLHVA